MQAVTWTCDVRLYVYKLLQGHTHLTATPLSLRSRSLQRDHGSLFDGAVESVFWWSNTLTCTPYPRSIPHWESCLESFSQNSHRNTSVVAVDFRPELGFQYGPFLSGRWTARHRGNGGVSLRAASHRLHHGWRPRVAWRQLELWRHVHTKPGQAETWGSGADQPLHAGRLFRFQSGLPHRLLRLPHGHAEKRDVAVFQVRVCRVHKCRSISGTGIPCTQMSQSISGTGIPCTQMSQHFRYKYIVYRNVHVFQVGVYSIQRCHSIWVRVYSHSEHRFPAPSSKLCQI